MSPSKLTAAVKGPVWIGIGTVVGAMAVAVAGISYVQGRQTPAGDIEIAAVSVGAPTEISAMSNSGPGTAYDVPVQGLTVSPIDITVKNIGGAPKRIHHVSTDLVGTAKFPCDPAGGGIRIQANFMITLPTVIENATLVGSDNSSADVDFSVPPNSSERMAVTVGPDSGMNGDVSPYVFVTKLRLDVADAESRVTQPVALITPKAIDRVLNNLHSDSLDPTRSVNASCISDYLADLNRMAPEGTPHSSEYDRWIDGLTEIVNNSN